MNQISPYLRKPLRSYSVAALERLRAKLDEALTACNDAEADDIKGYITDAIGDTALMIREEQEAAEPCSDEARYRGCSCRMPAIEQYDPEPIVDPYCQLHGGRDPDHDAEARREAREAV